MLLSELGQGLQRQAKSVPDYIMESIVEPSAYVVKWIPDHHAVPGKRLSAGALKKLRRLPFAGPGGKASKAS